MSKQELPTGFTAELNGNLLKVTATPSEVDKAGYVELQFGRLSVLVNITQSGEKELFLELSHQTLPMFTGEGTEVSEAITVTSSGPWTAKIYNDLSTFEFGTGGLDLTGNNLTQFTIKTIQDNQDIDNRYAFVLVTLDEDPDIARVVLVSQNGLGQLDLDPEGDLRFTADGATIDDPTYPDKYVITVDTENHREWNYSLYGLNPSYFTVTRVGETLEITTNGTNPEDAELTMQVRVYLEDNPTIRQEFIVTQLKDELTLNPATVGVVPTEGGTSDAVTITATGNWTATITSTGNTATFYSNGSTTLAGTAAGGEFRVVFPELTQGNIYPQATITVRLDGTNIVRTIVISQRELQGRVINIQNAETWYGYLTDDNTSLYRTNYMEQLYESLISTANFSTSGTFFCGGVDFLTVGRVPNNTTDIYVANCFNGTAAQGADIMAWLEASSNRVLLLLQDDRTSTMLSYLGLDQKGYVGTGGTGNNIFATNFARTLNTGSAYTVDNNVLYKYLLKDGPFTVGGATIAKDQVKLMPYDASNNCLTTWPPTMIPLMLDANNTDRLILGVDPTLRIIYLGELDLFTQVGTSTIYYIEDGLQYTAADNYTKGPYAETNTKFVNNLLAWMIEIVISGDAFTNQFK
ncbi:MAG: hypothetical protein LUD15_00810 [Bacteroides sp.]|nr:hypothetical protein [Bacteroides sp.]